MTPWRVGPTRGTHWSTAAGGSEGRGASGALLGRVRVGCGARFGRGLLVHAGARARLGRWAEEEGNRPRGVKRPFFYFK